MKSIIYNPIFWIFLSYAIGQIIADYLVKKRNVTWFEGHNYLSDKATRGLGVLVFGWVIRNTLLSLFNKKLKLKSSASIEALRTLKKEMLFAEAGHLVAFYVLILVNIVFLIYGLDLTYILCFFVINVVFNFYLVLLQQYNKRRIDRIIDLYSQEN